MIAAHIPGRTWPVDLYRHTPLDRPDVPVNQSPNSGGVRVRRPLTEALKTAGAR